jgi:tetratricopeptide (TPR) repeat protein
MKLLVPFFTKLYQYATVFLVVGSPLFFIPGTGFVPEVTYYVTIMAVTAIALLSYVISAVLTRSWHSVSRLEFISYFAFSAAVVLSIVFARDQRSAIFGEAFNPLSGASLLALPAIMYLTRTLPDALRTRMKYVIAIVLGASTFIFLSIFMMTGKFIDAIKPIFQGFSSGLSFAVYIGIFIAAMLFFVKKADMKARYKVITVLTAAVIVSWLVSVSSSEIRPDFASSLSVAKKTAFTDGIFGIGPGEYARAWQLYRPESVIQSPYFGYDFTQGYSTMMTLLTTIGLVGFISFIMLALSALYSTYRSYRQSQPGEEHAITGALTFVLLYLSIVSWVIPLSFALLVVWMAVGGLGLAKARLSEYHPSRKLAYVFVPLALLLAVNMVITAQKVRAFSAFGKAQTMLSTDGPTEKAGALLSVAAERYTYDGFHRAYVEYMILAERQLVSTEAQDKDALQQKYLENAQKAVDAGLKAVQINGNNFQNYVTLGRAYELAIPFDKENGYARAKESYEKAVQLYPNNPYLYVILARLEASAGTAEGVRTQLTEALKKKQNFADALYLMSQLEASEQKIDEAITYAVEAVKNAPNDPLVYIQAGLLFYGKKDYENAIMALGTALDKDPNNANIAYFLALALRDGGKPELAKQIADELAKQNPDNEDIKALVKSLDGASTSSDAPAATSTPSKTPAKK